MPLVLTNILGIAGIVVWHLQGSNRPTGRLIVQILFFAGMSFVLYLGGVSPQHGDDTNLQGFAALLAKSAMILWWTHLAWAIIGLVHIWLMLNRGPREAHLVRDMTVGVIYPGVALSIIGFVFGMPVGTLIATSGIVAVVFGLALQNTLGDMFSGIALTLGRAYAIGDWIRMKDGPEGRVIETNWRSANLLTAQYNVVVVPNSVLARQALTNLSRPDDTRQITLTVRIVPTQPSFVEQAMRCALQGSARIVKDPPPIVALKTIDAVAIEVDLLFRVANPADWAAAGNEIIDLIYSQCNADGLSLAAPAESIVFGPAAISAGKTVGRIDARSSRAV
ncbi:mechanosensitive ion channel family protein [Mesorhizobium sp. BH1-1-5]|uniref:mechanosensitive ion channel family protein n=1 Tax=unclassified Mesorhizobium TaxID=325217 RepID=UPI0011284B37|nr:MULTISPECIES: mechanosensitive ion channel family protein [unclassified Mesorhizobium]MBZ9991607.1 mechanosensitive ion channel family protein [Mesorhizobium sp. BH1-1-5]TPJ46795.1 mechanosensitive ion channel family protein [Mesorhizobium sp. B2-7-1]